MEVGLYCHSGVRCREAEGMDSYRLRLWLRQCHGSGGRLYIGHASKSFTAFARYGTARQGRRLIVSADWPIDAVYRRSSGHIEWTCRSAGRSVR